MVSLNALHAQGTPEDGKTLLNLHSLGNGIYRVEGLPRLGIHTTSSPVGGSITAPATGALRGVLKARLLLGRTPKPRRVFLFSSLIRGTRRVTLARWNGTRFVHVNVIIDPEYPAITIPIALITLGNGVLLKLVIGNQQTFLVAGGTGTPFPIPDSILSELR